MMKILAVCFRHRMAIAKTMQIEFNINKTL